MTISNSTTYYPYARVPLNTGTELMAYTGTPVVRDSSEVAPNNASIWEPPSAGAGTIVYHDGVGWVIGIDLTTASLATLQSLALNSATRVFKSAINNLSYAYSTHEQSSWAQQASEAQALASGGPTPLLSVLASAKGITVAALAQTVIEKNTVYQIGYATALAALQTARSVIAAANSIADLPAFTLAAVKVKR